MYIPVHPQPRQPQPGQILKILFSLSLSVGNLSLPLQLHHKSHYGGQVLCAPVIMLFFSCHLSLRICLGGRGGALDGGFGLATDIYSFDCSYINNSLA